MFSKTKSSKDPGQSVQQDQTPVKPAPPSILSTDLKVKGDLISAGEIQIDGAVDGDIRTVSLLVGESAVIKGEIIADKVRVHGTVNGQIKARTVSLAKSARVTGDILHEDLSIETGAFLEGHCKRIEKPQEIDDGKVNLMVKKDPAAVQQKTNMHPPAGKPDENKKAVSTA
ncbi:MAG: polymer-forming cytoskeletal protein [Rhodospirillales bacterium]|nr:polymer-forming cytoskeletal protein [Rhodospirillales bacterium]